MCTPYGFARLFTVIGQLVVKPQVWYKFPVLIFTNRDYLQKYECRKVEYISFIPQLQTLEPFNGDDLKSGT